MLRINLKVIQAARDCDVLLLQLCLCNLVIVLGRDIANVAAARMQHEPHTPILIMQNLYATLIWPLQ